MSGLIRNPSAKRRDDRVGLCLRAFSRALKYLKGFKIKNYTLS